ncbi:MAG: thiamine-phosphate kinase [Candidatus Hydrothermarchaeota archaeon]
MRVSEIGEKRLIEIISSQFSKAEWVEVGIGDDSSAIKIGEELLVITTDLITKKTDIPREMTPFQIGLSLVAITLSDIAAMGAVPRGILIAMGIPKETELEYIQKICTGIEHACKKFSAPVLGGDISESDELTLTGTAIGVTTKEEILLRKAIPGDNLIVTGEIGGAGAGLEILLRGISGYDHLIKRLLEPTPRIEEGIRIAKSKLARGCIDLSDSLSFALKEMMDINRCGFEIYSDKLPVTKDVKVISEEINIDWRDLVVNTGGDFELLFTVPEENTEKVLELISSSCNATVIGKAVADEKILLDGKEIVPRGFEHFFDK